ncbi:MAG TPA: DEAD/DEAH box helicase [Bacteroidetes bacterium]|nr:DEAD/DEAH box helicase [Bacteroidota bacterium]
MDFSKKTVADVLESLKRNPAFTRNVTEWKILPAQAGIYKDFPSDLSPELSKILQKRGIGKLYSHQSESYEWVRSGKNVVVVTPTASGKTLCYNLPVLQTLLEKPDTRALYLFPTKALSQDQVAELKGIADVLEQDVKTYTFDGDTPADARRTIRSSGHIVVTNPDMLHQGILPHHTKWIKLFENLKFVVLDEIHNYRGVFGSHMANVIRRLKRICEFYGTKPQFICSSATIANPGELASKILEEPIAVIDKNGAPGGTKHFIFYNPPVIDQKLGIRRSVVNETSRWSQIFLQNGIQTIVFARSRLRVEILVTYLKEIMRKAHKSPDLIRGYRGGYLPKQRREIEKGLREGKIWGVASTNALELGIDIGQLDICIMAGYPGTIASTWQQAGRAGRRQGLSAALLVASSAPMDQYIINHPNYFFEKPPESGIIDPNNLVILMSHLKCAAFELPFKKDEKFGPNVVVEILEYLEENGVLHREEDRFYWTSEIYPAEEVSLRSASPENFVIIDTTRENRVIGEMDLFSAAMLLHDEAIYIHESRQYHVDRLDWDRRKAYVRKVDTDYYTDAQLKTNIKVLDVTDRKTTAAGEKAWGEVSVTTVPTMFKKIKFHTHENLGWGKIELPELEMHTTSYWWIFPQRYEVLLREEGLDFGEGLYGISNVLANVAPLYIMSDPKDIRSVPMVRDPFNKRPAVYIYDNYPGGVGFSEKLFEIHAQLVQAAYDVIRKCPCESGCPSCVGPMLEIGEKGKVSALQILEFELGR